MSKKIVAIDPGLGGALAFFVGERPELVIDMPTMIRSIGKGRQINGYELSQIFLDEMPEQCYIEYVSSMPNDGKSSAFSFGEGYGVIKGVIATLQIPLEFVTPVVWKRKAGILKKEKDMARTVAIQRFPHLSGKLTRTKDIGRADALLIGMVAIGK